MALIENAKSEFQKSPIVVSSTVGGFIVALIMLSFALNSPSPVTEINNIQSSGIFFSLKNLLLCLAYYIFISISCASLIRIFSKYYDFTATLLSIPVAVIINFSTYISINLIPPTLFSKTQLLQISELLYWSTLILFVAICGKAVVQSLINTPTDNSRVASEGSKKENNTGSNEDNIKEDENTNKPTGDGIGSILLLFFFGLFIWGKMVSYGQDTLIYSLLPETWQPILEQDIEKKINNQP